MSALFLSPDAAESFAGRRPVARSPLAATLEGLGASFAERDGWSVVTGFGSADAEARACAGAVGVADRCELGKLELTAPPGRRGPSGGALGAEPATPGTASRTAGAWQCPITPDRTLILCEPAGTAALRARLGGDGHLVDLTTSLAAIALVGPRARDVLARVTALDVRPAQLPVGGFRPGSVARTPAMLLREGGDAYLVLFGAAYAQYMWTVLLDAATPLGGRPVGTKALADA